MPEIAILQSWRDGNSPRFEEFQLLQEKALQQSPGSPIFGVTRDTGLTKIAARSRLFQASILDLEKACGEIGLRDVETVYKLAWNLWLPLAIWLHDARLSHGKPLIQGLLGGQGTGKTTISWLLKIILQHLGDRAIAISLDDLYLSYQARQTLQQQDSRLLWRGPPGTHDVAAGIRVLDELRSPSSSEILVPRFDKSLHGGAGDAIAPVAVTPADIVFFEGWFVGVPPLPEAAFTTPPYPIVTSEDRQFALDCNHRLQAYLPLWQRLDRLIVLNPVDYRLSQEWRKEAEQKMIQQGKDGMGDREIEQFVEYFWKALHPELFIQPLTRNPDLVDLVIEINPDHSPGLVYKPE
ncbi:MAG: glycerate kinase [Jaaginema sp. PMC 1079.18]|nr:glycerate kinase [Jaaginema sp. PMC 1080.18]MEC4852801.1 glycerate kinase [Jaaginema sp. PMC 1079.18]MEC4864540.1 glycerate kinase [Jaaginema sp. PMC 1078.18]